LQYKILMDHVPLTILLPYYMWKVMITLKNSGVLLVFLSNNKTLSLVITYKNSHQEAFSRKNLY
jgi:hypothetical protein